MKKMLTGLLVFSVWAGGLSSMAREKGPATDFSLNLGIQTNAYGDSTFRHVWLSLDARAGLKVWGNLEISPEVMAVVDGGLDFTAVWVYPGAMLNLRLGAAFIGAGAVLPVVFVEGGTGDREPGNEGECRLQDGSG